MQRKDVRIKASGGGEFDCYVVTPQATGKVPGVVLASAIHGYMMPGGGEAYGAPTRRFSMERALAIPGGLRG